MSDVNRKPLVDAAESETLRMCGNSMHGNRETLEIPAPQGAGRFGKALCRTPDGHTGAGAYHRRRPGPRGDDHLHQRAPLLGARPRLDRGRRPSPGTELTSPDGSAVVVVSNTARLLDQPVNVYNIDVGGDHTYFVDDGTEPVWVHNCDCKALASEIKAAQPPYAQGRTVAVAILNNGERVVANSTKSLLEEEAIVKAEELGIDAIPGTASLHAEEKIIAYAGNRGLRIVEIGTTTKICGPESHNCLAQLIAHMFG